jgi:hypothetical protein
LTLLRISFEKYMKAERAPLGALGSFFLRAFFCSPSSVFSPFSPFLDEGATGHPAIFKIIQTVSTTMLNKHFEMDKACESCFLPCGVGFFEEGGDPTSASPAVSRFRFVLMISATEMPEMRKA